MCGISAWITKQKYNKNLFIKMNNKVSHRGPDGEGFFDTQINDTTIALGHRRLSIIDLSDKGKQPMSFDDNLFITYNGEIYNYLEIKEELKKIGFSFNSNTDTEVLLKAYSHWGKDCLNKFNGMFAFVIFDKKENKLFLARDRFGIKPLYYSLKENDLKIASEIKQFTVFEDFESVGNIKTIYDFLANRHLDHTNETFFKGINQLLGGEYIELDLKNFQFKKNKWYKIEDKINLTKNKNSVQEFKNLFKNTIKLRLRSDVEVGSCLSGGLDSSSIVCIADELLKNKKPYSLQVFNSSFLEKKFDESNYVKTIEENRNIKTNYTYPQGKNFFNKIEKIIYHQDEPIWSSSIYSQEQIFLAANKNKVKVMLDGQGADEIFAGYVSHFYPYYIKELIKKFKFSLLFSEIFKGNYKKRTIKEIGLIMLKLFTKKNITQSKKIFKKDFYFNKNCVNIDSVRDKSVYFIKYHLPALLHYEDRNSMAHSIESRLPFLDYRLVEFGLNLKAEEKIRKGIGKTIIRKAMKNIVPDSIIGRKDKMGFITPQKKWMLENIEQLIKAVKNLHSLNLFNDKYLKNLENKLNKKNFEKNEIMRIYTFYIWTKVFKIKKFYEQ